MLGVSVRIMFVIEERDLVDGRVSPAQGEHRREGTEIGSAQHDEPRNLSLAITRHGGTRDQAPHAVRHERYRSR